MEQKTAPVYRNISVYRFFMGLLYPGFYKARFEQLFGIIKNEQPKKVLELCFADTHIAKRCKENKIDWMGIDVNKKFVERANTLGFAAECSDVTADKPFPQSDVCLIAGSLYHFTGEKLETLIKKMVDSTDKLIISEPVKNMSAGKGMMSKIASWLTGKHDFRYDREIFMAKMQELSAAFNLNCRVAGENKRDLIVILEKNKV